MMTAQSLAEALGGARKNGRGWYCRCPAHDDREPSLSIVESAGQVLFTCRAGCSQDAVIAALRRRDLWSAERPDPAHETVYDYCDAAGALRYQVVRRPGKKFVQRRPDGAGGWVWNMQGVEALPYRLRELIAATADALVFIVEGEKDADNLASLGLVASCNHGGAGKWRTGLNQWFAGRDVVILPDNDEPGRRHAEAVANHLHEVAGGIRVLDLPALPPKGDVSDWIAAGGTRDRLLVLAAAAPAWEPVSGSAGDGESGDDDAEIARLVRLKPLAYEREREASAEKLGCRVSMLDKLVAGERGDSAGPSGQGAAIDFADPTPWGEPVDGFDLVAAIRDLVKRHVGLPAGAGWAAAVWVLHTYLFETGEHTPRLAIVSPERGCGKTTLLDLLGRLVWRPLSAASLTAAATFRVIDKHHPCLLIDEADAFLKDNEELRGVLNAGHRYDGAVLRVVGEDMEPRRFGVFAPVAIAMIGALPGTLADRSITIRMRRAGPGETIEPTRQISHDCVGELVRRARRWAEDHRAVLRSAEPAMPASMWNRTADNWRPLFAIAEACGGSLPDLLGDAAETVIAQNALDPQTLGVMLLADIRQVFEAEACDRIASAELVRRLVALEERPWGALGKRDKPLNPRRVGDLLRPYGISTNNTIRIAGSSTKGYAREQFSDAWDRYLDPPRGIA